jgi:tryptophan synthase alpha chain
MRSITDKPIGLGFGISGTEQARQAMDWGADGVIVGSAFVQRLANGSPAEGLQAIEQLSQELKAAIARPSLQTVG